MANFRLVKIKTLLEKALAGINKTIRALEVADYVGAGSGQFDACKFTSEAFSILESMEKEVIQGGSLNFDQAMDILLDPQEPESFGSIVNAMLDTPPGNKKPKTKRKKHRRP